MSIDLHIPKPVRRSKRQVELPEDVWALLDRYLEAAKFSEAHATLELVLEALLRKQLKKDRAFQRWLKQQSSSEQIHS